MISHMMKLNGERNVDRFRRVNVNVAPPGADLAGQAKAGNIIPLGAQGGRRGGGNAGTGSSGGTI
jgi:hypothetical protein